MSPFRPPCVAANDLVPPQTSQPSTACQRLFCSVAASPTPTRLALCLASFPSFLFLSFGPRKKTFPRRLHWFPSSHLLTSSLQRGPGDQFSCLELVACVLTGGRTHLAVARPSAEAGSQGSRPVRMDPATFMTGVWYLEA